MGRARNEKDVKDAGAPPKEHLPHDDAPWLRFILGDGMSLRNLARPGQGLLPSGIPAGGGEAIGGEGKSPDGVGSGPGGENDAIAHLPCFPEVHEPRTGYRRSLSPSVRGMCEPCSRGLLEELPGCS